MVAIAAMLLLAACGSSSETASNPVREPSRESTERPLATNDPCEPRRFDGDVEDPPRRAEQDSEEAVAIGSTELVLEVVGTELPTSIPISFADRPPFEAPKGSMLVAVSYRVRNEGPRELKPSEDLNTRLLLRASGALYPHAVALPCSIPLAASWAVDHGGVNPATPLPAGDSVTSAVVFVVPKQQPDTALSLVLPGQVGIALSPGG